MRNLLSRFLSRLFAGFCLLLLAQVVELQNAVAEEPAAIPTQTTNNAPVEFWRRLLGLPAHNVQAIPPVLVRALVMAGLADDQKHATILSLERSLATVGTVVQVKVFVGHAETETPLAQSLYQREVLFEVYWSAERPNLQKNSAISEEVAQRVAGWPPNVVATMLETSERPPTVLSQASYSLAHLEFVPDREKLNRLGVTLLELAAALSSNPGSHGDITIAGRRLAMENIGHFVRRDTEFIRDKLPPGKWTPWDTPRPSATQN